jgi:hypothetical protein
MTKVKKVAQAEPESDAKGTPWTMSVPAAGRRYFGLGKYASYQAAEEGLIPYVRVGRLMRALPRKIESRLTGSDDNAE